VLKLSLKLSENNPDGLIEKSRDMGATWLFVEEY
jgi:hypothetical protein